MPAAIKVLVLDDEPFMLGLLERILRQLGMAQVVTFRSAYEALYEMDQSESAPDLILLDLSMPDMDGVEFLRQLGERHYEGALILVSGEDEYTLLSVEKLVQAHRITALGHLHKPVLPQALAALIEKWQPAVGENHRVSRMAFGSDDVRAALANGELELVNHYQPKVALASGELVGVEARVRWSNPIAGLLYPDQFINVVETSGLSGDLRRAVLEAALEQASVWRKAGVTLELSVNVSVEDLTCLDFPDIVANLAIVKGVSPDRVMLEVKEGGLTENLTSALDVLNRLRLKRFRLSIDDFGTGHSSLAQLRDCAFDELKIDRSFVHGARTDAKLLSIYSASLELGKQLHMKVVAEGVEDRADWEFVRRSACDLAQGHFIANAMPAADLINWQASWKTRLSKEALLAA
jgi:EAL domain-containing protein (putative c-di-GMP-specific phosphodiesterase class I)